MIDSSNYFYIDLCSLFKKLDNWLNDSESDVNKNNKMVSLAFHTDNESSDQCRISFLLDTLTRVMYMHFFCSRC